MKPLKAYAIVNKKNPKLKFLDIFPTKDVNIAKDEKIIEVEIYAKQK